MAVVKYLFKAIIILSLFVMSIKLYEVSFPLVIVAWFLFITFAVIWGNLHEED